MQLHPFYATISRPIYWDRLGNLYKLVECGECKGSGQLQSCPINPSEPDFWAACTCCGGEGEVYEQADEDEIATEENK